MSIGVGIALIIGGAATFFGLDRDRAPYPVMVMAIASYYALSAVMGGSVQILIVESAGAAAFPGL